MSDTNRTRGFEVISKLQNAKDKPLIPQRSTEGSAGYDIRANEDVLVPSILKSLFLYTDSHDNAGRVNDTTYERVIQKNVSGLIKATKPTIIHTGIKAYMRHDEVLYIHDRSSDPIKRGLHIVNNPGVIDSDFYNNPKNEGEILIAMINFGPNDYMIHSGDRIAQGIFGNYKKTDQDHPVAKKRDGGFGSTGK